MVKSGDRVRLTADFLRSTGQVVGGEGGKTWTVVGCDCGLCKLGRHVAVDAWMEGYDPPLRRHICRDNVQRVGELRADRVPQAGFLKKL